MHACVICHLDYVFQTQRNMVIFSFLFMLNIHTCSRDGGFRPDGLMRGRQSSQQRGMMEQINVCYSLFLLLPTLKSPISEVRI